MPTFIYIVDDEPLIAEMLGQYLTYSCKAWQVRCFTQPGVVIEESRTRKPNVVISDFRMPEMTGTAMLEEIRQIAPESIRVLISGYIHSKALDNRLSSAHQYLAKPFSMPDIRGKIQKALNALEGFQNEKVRHEVLALRTLPALPKIYYQLLATLEDTESSYSQVEAILSKDTAIIAKVLQMANSPLFGGQSRATVTDLLQCITILGTERLKAVVLSHQVFKSYPNIPECFYPENITQHRMDTADLAYGFAKAMKLNEEQARDAYVAGLLHDLGRLVLIDNFAPEHEAARQQAKAEGKPLAEMEKSVFQISHADVLGFLVALWGMRDRIAHALTYQDHPWNAPTEESQKTAAAVYLAHYKAHLAHSSEQFVQPALNEDYLKKNDWMSLLN
jgi:HD-like signal output (HDOD) protein/CheY-like chemotaxis protein